MEVKLIFRFSKCDYWFTVDVDLILIKEIAFFFIAFFRYHISLVFPAFLFLSYDDVIFIAYGPF